MQQNIIISDKYTNELSNNSDLSLKKLVNQFLLQSDITKASRQTYSRSLNKFINWCQAEFKFNNYAFTKNTILLYKSFLLEDKIKPFTKSLYLTCLRQFFTWTEAHLIYPNIAKGIKGIKKLTRQHHKDSFSKDQIIFLLKSINKNNLFEIRDYTLIYLLVHTGLRLIEVSSILIEDIEINSLDQSAIIWIRGKGRDGKDAFIVLIKEVFEVVQNYIELRNKYEKINLKPDSYLFVSHGPRTKKNYSYKLSTSSLSRIIKNRIKLAGLKSKRISAHSLRHTFGVMAIQSGASLYEVQLAMRHSSSNTTQIYLGDIEQIKRKEASPENKVFNFISS
jgi:integrase/recombinase XerD